MPGAERLRDSEELQQLLVSQRDSGKVWAMHREALLSSQTVSLQRGRPQVVAHACMHACMQGPSHACFSLRNEQYASPD